jgi:hypothetical protein
MIKAGSTGTSGMLTCNVSSARYHFYYRSQFNWCSDIMECYGIPEFSGRQATVFMAHIIDFVLTLIGRFKA